MKFCKIIFAGLLAVAVLGCAGCNNSDPRKDIMEFGESSVEVSLEVMDDVKNSKTYKFLTECVDLETGVIEVHINDSKDAAVFIKDKDNVYTRSISNSVLSPDAVLIYDKKYYVIDPSAKEYVLLPDDYKIETNIISNMRDIFNKMKLSGSGKDYEEFTVRDELVFVSNNGVEIMPSGSENISSSIRTSMIDNGLRMESVVSSGSGDVIEIVRRDITEEDRKLLDLKNYKKYEESSESSEK